MNFWECYDRDTYEKLSAADLYCEYDLAEEELTAATFMAVSEEYDREGQENRVRG